MKQRFEGEIIIAMAGDLAVDLFAYNPAAPQTPLPGNILLICGPTGVGKSTIGFELYLKTRRGGLTAGYVDPISSDSSMPQGSTTPAVTG